MISGFRSVVLAAGAAALLTSQAAVAAPAIVRTAVDPLVSLSVLGSAQSRAAVCAGSTAAAAAAAAAAQGAPAPGCVLPVTGAPLAPVANVGPPPMVETPGKSIGALPIVLGLLAVLALAALLLDGDGDGDPVSPD